MEFLPVRPICMGPISILSCLLRESIHRGFFPSGFLTKFCTNSSTIRAACSIYLFQNDLTILIVFDGEIKWRSYSLCSFLHPPANLSFFQSNILISIMFSNTFSSCQFKDSGLSLTSAQTLGEIVLRCILLSFTLRQHTRRRRFRK
jgi:hypothetical protein